MRFLAILIIINLFAISFVQAKESDGLFDKFKGLILDNPTPKIQLKTRPKIDTPNISNCIDTQPYDHKTLIHHIGERARILANGTNAAVNTLSFQPRFGGLKGPKITIMRDDFERAIINNNGSANEIHHNATIESPSYHACDKRLKAHWDLELQHHIDALESHEKPLLRSDAILNGRIHFGGYFMGTTSIRQKLYSNLGDDDALRTLDRLDPIRQDIIGFAEQRVGLDRLLLSGFSTPSPDLHLGVHAGILEEGFMGIGSELLYRPHNKNWSLGAEIWGVQKRLPYTGKLFGVNGLDSPRTTALLNLHYDIPQSPYSVGLSGGQFLDSDYGIEAKGIYRPAQGWAIEGFVTLSNKNDRTLRNRRTNLFSGIKLTMPLGQLKYLPDNSRQTFDFSPFARDKGQRIDNPYPLYDLTNPWQTSQIQQYWNEITE